MALGILGSFLGTVVNALFGGLTERVINSSLTGKEREQNTYNAKQAALQRDFAREERLSTESFNAQQALLQRDFSREERLQSQDFNAEQAQLARDFSHNEAQEQMAFQERMSNSQWQRGIADMKAAGLNPALAYGQGGASAMSGAMGSAVSAQGSFGSGSAASASPASGSAASGSAQIQGLSSILELLKLRRDFEILDVQKEKIGQESRATEIANTIAENFGMQKASLEVEQLGKQISLIVSQIGVADAQKVLYALEQEVAKAEKEGYDINNAYSKWRSDFVQKYHVSPEFGEKLIDVISRLGSSAIQIVAARNLLSGSVRRQEGGYKVPSSSSKGKRYSPGESWNPSISYRNTPSYHSDGTYW